MKIFLTGASGFIGSNMARRLIQEGHELHVSLRNEPNWRLKDICNQMEIHKVDIRDFNTLQKELDAINPEAVIHMATYGAYPTVQTEMKKIVETNLIGTINLARACKCIMINTGSSSEYGLSNKPMQETDLPAPINYYGATKAGATVFCQTHSRLTGVPIITTRLFSVYGPYEEPMRLVPSTINKCLSNMPLDFTNGLQPRDFIYVSDVEDAYLELITRPDLGGEILNVGTGRQSTVRDMVNGIVKETKTSSVPNWGVLPTRENEASQKWVADVRKADCLLDWRPNTNLETGIKKTVVWMRA